MLTQEIETIKQRFVEQILPIQIYLFGSHANQTHTAQSDLDFYIIVPDNIEDLANETVKAYKAIRKIKNHPVDIVLGTQSHFEARRNFPSIEHEVYHKGVLLYDARSTKMA